MATRRTTRSTSQPGEGQGTSPDPTSLEEINKVMDAWARQFETLMQQHQQTMDEARQRYEQQVAEAERSLQQIIQSGSGGVPGQPPPKKPGEIDMSKPPAAEWMQLESGERFLVLNVQAAVMFMAIFDRLGPVLDEVKTLVTKMRR